MTRLEPVNAGMREELAALQGERPDIIEQKEVHMQENMRESTGQQSRQEVTGERRSRRQLLRKGIVAATAALGVGAVLDTGIASAHTNLPADNVGNFSSSIASVPAVTTTGTNGAVGVQATSDSGNGVHASSSSFDAIHAIGNTSGRSGVFAEGGAGFGVYATSNTSIGVFGFSQSGIGKEAQSTSGDVFHAFTAGGGAAVTAQSGSGPALVAIGSVHIQGNSVGQATLPAGTTSVTVTTSAATTSSIIMLTPLSKPKTLWVTRANGSFTIHASASSTSNIVIAYLIVN
jgi:hypothetical protein